MGTSFHLRTGYGFPLFFLNNLIGVFDSCCLRYHCVSRTISILGQINSPRHRSRIDTLAAHDICNGDVSENMGVIVGLLGL